MKLLSGKGSAGNAARKHAEVVILSGELGAGKTTFVQGFLKGAGIRGRAASPTFVIMRHYRIARSASKDIAPFANIIHMDAYRLPLVATTTKNAAHLIALKFDEIVGDPGNIVLIEWGERIAGAVPKGALRVQFRYDKKEGSRIITIK
ncbi:MAG: tRNA (adenosine(37)-N6)-threonylcarbamoyltransferase complex ATPase subunit type 1 TsaE [Candidatus Pacebacteria bacterium]|nr:tRNA (adenosine(37)-N6)-threonylcarbamoyltransferase complex ATPase subunit type 1 TsaE [Candidatus Paceibacterota bacterium]